MKNIIFAAALLAFCSPAFAGQVGTGGTAVSGYSSTIGGGAGRTTVSSHSGNQSDVTVAAGAGGQMSTGQTHSWGGGTGKRGSGFDYSAGGTYQGWTHGQIGTHGYHQ